MDERQRAEVEFFDYVTSSYRYFMAGGLPACFYSLCVTTLGPQEPADAGSWSAKSRLEEEGLHAHAGWGHHML